ncbi:MAG TPA: carbohydrate kinase [Verrucomicrobia bacterium]|nr:carbohydrate kinase [Verrucomicrobiota bacterium]
MNSVSRADVEHLLARFSALHIGVIGDFALDCYWQLDTAAELPSVETGKPTRPVSTQHYAAGAAGNVVADLAALGCGKISAFGVVGPDPWGNELRRWLDAHTVDTAGLLVQPQDWDTVAYVKPHIQGVEQNRFDFGDFNQLHADTTNRLIDSLSQTLPRLDALVINAQARAGLHHAHLRPRLAALIQSQPDRLFTIDTRDRLAMYSGGILKINDIEASRMCDLPTKPGIPHAQACAAAARLFAERRHPVFVTCGPDGMVVCDAHGLSEIEGIRLQGPIDTTGAGDAAMAGITAALASRATPHQAAFIGNLAAAVCAGKLHQTGTASPSEILALLTKPAPSEPCQSDQ